MTFGKRKQSWVLVALMVASTVLVGCIGATDDLEEQSVDRTLDELLGTVLTLREDQGFEINVPVDVYLVGFEPGTGESLQDVLESEKVAHIYSSFTRTVPPNPEDPQPPLDFQAWSMPVLPKAQYQVQQVPAALADTFFQAVSAQPVDSDLPGIFDANAAEEHLAQALPTAGFELDPARPAFVILHAGDRLPEDHGWRYTYSHGYLEPVRAFGERYAFTVYDTSAQPDPFVVEESTSATGLVFSTVFGPPEVKEYNYQMEAGGADTVSLLQELVVDATHYRLLKGAIYPVSTKACHKVTLLMAVHQTALTEALPDQKTAEAWLDTDGLQAGFENLTDDEVVVEERWLTLPQDDPVLDALTRQSAGPGGLAVFLDALRWHLDENWDQYVNSEPGCEDYLSIMLYADPTSEFGRLFSGIGMYDVDSDRRISFSVVTDVRRIRDAYQGPAEEVVSTDSESREPNWINLLFAHETGHLFGLHHPQHLSKDGAPSPSIDTFQSIWSTMSYQTDDRIHDFGMMDRAQWQRARAGFIVQQAQLLDLEDTPAFEQALQAAGTYDWAGTQAALEALVHQEGHVHGADLIPHVSGYHHHPR